MAFPIVSLSSQQDRAYDNPSLGLMQGLDVSHKVAYINWVRYAAFMDMMKRFVDFLLHYSHLHPGRCYLFKKYTEREFSKIEKQLQYSEAEVDDVTDQNACDANLRSSNRVNKFASDAFWIKGFDNISFPISRLPLQIDFHDKAEFALDLPSPIPLTRDEEGYLVVEPSKEVIGINAGASARTFHDYFWDYTFGLVLNETMKKECLSWKIKRYEDLIIGVQQKVLEYIKSQEELGNIDKLITEAATATAPEWMRQILPILKFCRKQIRGDDQRLNPEYLEKVRQSYNDEMLVQLRQAAIWAKDHNQADGVQHVDAICYQLYAAVDINLRCKDIFETFLMLAEKDANRKSPSQLNEPCYAMIQDIREAHEKIQAVPNEARAPLVNRWANSAKGYLNGFMGLAAFDPNLQSNPMHILFHKMIVKDDCVRKVKGIAMGSPTIETGFGSPKINPEFQGFLRHLKRSGQTHLYINSQDYMPRGWMGGDESGRCQALHDLAENEFKGTLFVITLSQNSPFYTQTGEYATSHVSAVSFKNELISQMFDHEPRKTGNCIPVDLINRFDLHSWSIEASNKIHSIFFADRENLTVEERRIFIRIFNQNLTRKILLETQVNSYNSSCKDRIDRGASIDSEDYAYLAILQNCMNEHHVIEFFKMLVFARAIIVRKRTMIDGHLERLVETVKFMIDHQKQLQQLQYRLFPGIELTIDQFVLKPRQE